MFSATTRRVAQNATRRYISTTSRSSTTSIPRTAVLAGAAIAGTVLGGVALLIPAAHADGTMLDDLTQTMEEKSKYLKAPTPSGERNTLETFAWGSNKNHTISAVDDYDTRKPLPLSFSGNGVALRDLAFHERHAACVDASGDVYQWGDGLFEEGSSGSKEPKLTLKGKDIVQVALTPEKVYALSRGGNIYVISSLSKLQPVNPQTPVTNASWWNPAQLWAETPSVDYVELDTNISLGKSERFTSISAGASHLLALTSLGRTFSSPVSSSANSHGQLGVRNVQLTSPASSTGRMSIEMLPKAQKDPFSLSTPAVRTSIAADSSSPLGETLHDGDIRFCQTLFEVPALRGVNIAAVTAGNRTSYALTSTGRVLGWGANEYGQLGLGGAFTMTYVPVPTEISLSKNYPSGSSIKCLDVQAGGDVVYFTVQAQKRGSALTDVDLLAAGMGQYGSLGNKTYSQAQATPVRVKTISGVQEYNDALRATQPLAPKYVSASPTNHAVAVLDTFLVGGSAPRDGKESLLKGRDIYTWGANWDSQLGLNKRSHAAQPAPLPSDGFAGGYDVDSNVARMMTRERKVDVLRNFQGKQVKKNALVEQTVVTGWGCTAIYWKVVP